MAKQNVDTFLRERDFAEEIREYGVTSKTSLDVVVYFLIGISLDIHGSNPLVLDGF